MQAGWNQIAGKFRFWQNKKSELKRPEKENWLKK